MKRVVRVKALSDTPYLISEEAADVIGKGSYGKVVRAYNRTDASKRYAVKVFELNSLKEHRSGLQELSIVGKLPRNPNLVHYEKIKLTSKNCMYLVMEECNGGTLSQLLARSESLTDSEICQFVSDFVNGYRCLYECGIVHRDIKTDNVLLHDGRYKIADFGLSKIMQERSKTTSIRGSPVFLAPELFHKGTSGSKLDVYSFGVTLYYACYKRYPYTSRLRYVSMEELLADINRSELMLPTGRSDWLQQLLRSTLQRNPEDRIDWPSVFQLCADLKPSHQNLISKPIQAVQDVVELKAVQTSNTEMRDLELLDLDLLLSLRPESVVLLNELEKSLIRKRQLILFLDRLRGKLRCYPPNPSIDEFRQIAATHSYQALTEIDEELQLTVSRLSQKDKLQFIESRNYKLVSKLLREDHEELQSQLSTEHNAEQSRQLKMRLYKLCPVLIQLLIEGDHLKTAVYLFELEKFLNGDSSSVLSPNNKDIDSLDKFIATTEAACHQQLKGVLSSHYEYLFL